MPKDIQTVVDSVVGAMSEEELVDQAPGPVQIAEKDPTEAQVKEIVEKLQHPSWYNGYLGIARAVGVSTHTVVRVRKAVIVRLAELSAEEEPVVVEP